MKKIILIILSWLKPIIHFSIKPEQGCRIEDDHLCFEGNDPSTKIIPNIKSDLFFGFYMLEVTFEDISRLCQSNLYIDYGEGFSEEDSFQLTLHKKSAKRICFFRTAVKQFRFDPHLNGEGAIKNLKIKLTKLTNRKADKLIKKKLINFHQHASQCIRDNLDAYNNLFLSKQQGVDYHDWIKRNEHQSTYDQFHDNDFTIKPLFSIIIPTYNTEPKLLQACIESALNQSYPYFEICIADDASTEKNTLDCLQTIEKSNNKIKISFRKKNGHISIASNSALAIANGDYIVLLDHDDLLAKNALLEVAKVINDHPDANIIYSDEDKIDVNGNRSEPHFKSSWNPDLLYSQNYISHLGVYRKSIIDTIGGFRVGFEGSQDYDLLLRAIDQCDRQGIYHIPKVLYHWRAIEGSTALDEGEKSYTLSAGEKALQEHFASRKEKVTVSLGCKANTYKVFWHYKTEPLVSLIIPTYNAHQITKQAIDSIINKTTYQNYEILLVDNNSDDPTSLAYFDEIAKHSKVTLLKYPHPFNYSAINNFAAKQAKGEILGLINNDIEVINPEWLTEMVSHALRPDIGCVGAKLFYANDTIQHAGVILGLGGVAGHSHKHFPKDDFGYFCRLVITQNLSAVTAACLLVRKSIFKEVHGLNESDLTVAFNDVDFCLKVQQAGYRNLWTPYAELYHHESISRGAEDNPEKVARFNKEADYMKTVWHTHKKPDPYYSTNLTLIKEDFSLS